jgi:Nif-specific regulatory protein
MVRLPKKIGKYTLTEKIAESNYAELYIISDEAGHNYILKIARTDSANDIGLIAREYRILSQITHPNIVGVHDYDKHNDGRAYFTSEYVPGNPINEYFKGFSEDFVAAMLQIMSALGVFHNKGFVHCDLKPEHMLYDTNAKLVKLIDFGFAGVPEQDIQAAGTMGYMAPEVLKGIVLNQRSDLYSLGVITYEILSGDKTHQTFAPLKDIPEEIGKMVTRLVSVEPALRPSIPELYHTFSKYAPSTDVSIPTYEVRLPSTAYVEPEPIIESIFSAKGEPTIVTGDVGLGKTRLVQELKYRYLMEGYEVIHYQSTQKTGLLDALRRKLAIEESTVEQIEDKYQIFEDITQAISRFSTDRDFLIAVDDIDVLSDYELALFRYIGYGTKDTNVLLIGTSKQSERISKLGFQIIALKPLAKAAIAQIIDRTFTDITVCEGFNLENFTDWLHKQSGGNPFFCVELLKTLYDKEVLLYRSNRWQIEVQKLGEISVPKNIEDLIASRLEELNRDDMQILKILHLASYPLEVSIISSIFGKFDISLENLKNLGLIGEETITGHRMIVITNKLIATAIDKKIGKEERKKICKKIIAAIDNSAPGDIRYVSLRAKLHAECGDTKEAYYYYRLAADAAEEIYDYSTALTLYEKITAYAQTIDTSKYAKYITKLGDINHILGNNPAAIDHYNTALKANGKSIIAEANLGLGKIHSSMGQYDEALVHYKQALAATQLGTAEYITIANLIGYANTNLRRFGEATQMLSETLNQAQKLKDDVAEADTLYYLASLEWYKGDFKKGIAIASNLLIYCKKYGILKQYAFCASLLGSLYQQNKDFNSAQKYFDIAIDAFQEIKRVDGLAAVLNNSGLQQTQQGKLRDASILFQKALQIAQKTDNKGIYLVSLTNLAIINATLGKYHEAIRDYSRLLTKEPEYTWAVYGKSRALLATGQYDEANELLQKAEKQDILFSIGQASINEAAANISASSAILARTLKAVEESKPFMSTQIEVFLQAGCLYFELGDYDSSLKSVMRLLELTYEGSREHSIGQALSKMNNYLMGKEENIDIEGEISRLKELGCIYDYAYLKRLLVASLVTKGQVQDNVRRIVEELSAAQEVFESLGAELELSKLRKVQGKLFPFIVEDYSRRVISEQYLQTFSGIAELISSDLGDEHFVQNILDLVIKATNAERGALFIKSTKGMDFLAGRDIDQTTIKDASELSHTAIKHLEKGKILFAQDALSDPTFNIKKSVMLNQIRSLLCIPLSVSDNVIGAIYLDSRITSGIFGPQDKEFLLTISKILASVIEKSMAFRSMSEENILLKTNIIKEIGSGHLIGKSRVMKEVYRLIDSVAETNSPVLILGETGTGKGMIARLIHLRSQRKNKNFLSINCGTIPETLLESELFGHKKGAFTGAISDKKGLLEEGEGGTVFLDEITNTSLEFQGKLLEAIEEKIIRRVGETTTRNIDVRFLFATNRDLEIEVEDNRFRRDLFYRINVFKIEVPPLRDRASDIPLLAQFFLERYTKEINKKIDGFAPESMQRLREYLWPGNVRELQNVIERAVVLAKGKLINLQDIGFEKTKSAEIMPLKDIKKEAVIEALNLANWNVTKAAKMLHIGRRSLHRYIKKFNIVNDSTFSIGRNQK